MRKNLIWAIIVIGAVVLQTTWLNAIRLQGVLPDLTLLLVVYYAVADGEERAMCTGFLAGVYQDVAGDAVLGHHVLCNVVVGYIIGRVAKRLVLEHPIVKVGLVMVASLLQGIMFVSIAYVQTPGTSAVRDFLAAVVPTAFYSALVTPVVFFALRRILQRREEAA